MARLRHPTPLQVLLPMPTVPLLTLPQMARPAISIGMSELSKLLGEDGENGNSEDTQA